MNDDWTRSTRCTSGTCTQVRYLPGAGVVAVRDSKDPTGPTLTFDRATWQAFIDTIKGGAL